MKFNVEIKEEIRDIVRPKHFRLKHIKQYDLLLCFMGVKRARTIQSRSNRERYSKETIRTQKGCKSVVKKSSQLATYFTSTIIATKNITKIAS